MVRFGCHLLANIVEPRTPYANLIGDCARITYVFSGPFRTRVVRGGPLKNIRFTKNVRFTKKYFFLKSMFFYKCYIFIFYIFCIFHIFYIFSIFSIFSIYFILKNVYFFESAIFFISGPPRTPYPPVNFVFISLQSYLL